MISPFFFETWTGHPFDLDWLHPDAANPSNPHNKNSIFFPLSVAAAPISPFDLSLRLLTQWNLNPSKSPNHAPLQAMPPAVRGQTPWRCIVPSLPRGGNVWLLCFQEIWRLKVLGCGTKKWRSFGLVFYIECNSKSKLSGAEGFKIGSEISRWHVTRY